MTVFLKWFRGTLVWSFDGKNGDRYLLIKRPKRDKKAQDWINEIISEEALKELSHLDDIQNERGGE